MYEELVDYLRFQLTKLVTSCCKYYVLPVRPTVNFILSFILKYYYIIGLSFVLYSFSG